MNSFPSSVFYQNTTKTDVQILRDREDHGSIIKSKKLFWEAFCEVTGIKSEYAHSPYDVSQTRSEFEIKRNAVEELRYFFDIGYRERMSIQIAYPFFDGNMFVQRKGEGKVLNLINRRRSSIDIRFFEDIIKPNLERLGEFVGAKSRTFQEKMDVTKTCGLVNPTGICSIKHNCRIIKIEWKKNATYPITPLPVKIPPKEMAPFYEMWQKGELCDVELKPKTGSTLTAHVVCLSAYGGEVIKTLFASKMKDRRSIEFPEFDESVVQAYLDFVYMPFEKFQEKYEKEGSCDFFELFYFAHTYQVEPLIDYSINLLLLFCQQPSELKRVQNLAETYGHLHPKLQEFAEYLEKQSRSVSTSSTSITESSVAPMPLDSENEQPRATMALPSVTSIVAALSTGSLPPSETSTSTTSLPQIQQFSQTPTLSTLQSQQALQRHQTPSAVTPMSVDSEGAQSETAMDASSATSSSRTSSSDSLSGNKRKSPASSLLVPQPQAGQLSQIQQASSTLPNPLLKDNGKKKQRV